jgi:hypothetical protein
VATSEYGAGTFGAKYGKPWVKQSEADPTKGSEYGGVEGLIAPPPHDVKAVASEQLMLLMNTDPADENSGVDLPPMKTVRDYLE